MKLITTARRAAVAATSTAVVAGALVGASATSAQAAEGTSTYNCGAAGELPLTVTGGFPAETWAGAKVAKGLLQATAVAKVGADVAGLLQALGIDNAESRDFAFGLGPASVPLPLAGDFVTDDAGTRFEGAGTNKAFTTPKPGTYKVSLPETFTITTRSGEADAVPLTCTLPEGTKPATVGSVKVRKQVADLSAPKAVTAKLGKKAVVPVTVKNSTGAATGKVVAKKGNKTVATAKLNKAGKAKLTIAKLGLGASKITVKYVGGPSVKGDSAKVTVKVTK